MNISYSQKIEIIKDSVEFQKFNDYVNNVLDLEKDSSVSSFSHSKYRIIYHSICPYTLFGSSEILVVSDTGICMEKPGIIQDTTLYNIYTKRTSNINKEETIILIIDKPICGMNDFKFVSYNRNRNVIIKKSYILNVGDYISTGSTETFFLEKTE